MKQKAYWRTNQQIHAPKVRVIGASGKQIGVLEIRKALEEAKKAELDLVEIAPKANPPVVKIVNFGKFKYQEEKKLRKQKKGIKSVDIKEIRFSPFIADGDYNTRLERINEFLDEGHKIRLVVKFQGKQLGSKQFGYDLLKRVINSLQERITVDTEVKFIGRHLITVVSPLAKSRRVKEQESISNKK